MPFFDLFGVNKIGSIDPKTMKITEYPLPDPNARPWRIAIAPDDTVYYTDYARGMLGRLHPDTGNVEEYPSPGGGESRPYAIAVAPNGVVWYARRVMTRRADHCSGPGLPFPAPNTLAPWPRRGRG